MENSVKNFQERSFMSIVMKKRESDFIKYK